MLLLKLIAYTYGHLYDSTTGLQFYTVYSPLVRPDMAYFLFTDVIIKGKPFKVFNNGTMKRDFTYINDIAEGIARIIEMETKK
ncbi:MAG: NAD-dependent epimerase/dehydratase family protein [Oleispira sp.]|nr:NAD-dependent epimerase/dehydratase family protein [Oleispira sp.]